MTKAKPLFNGHYQPRLPADLGFYDLRVPEVREQQAQLAREYGIYGFCYYHYWFGGGKQLLERPIKEVLESGSPEFPFMFCWANHKWSSIWIGNDSPEVLMDQNYPGPDDYKRHFLYLLPFFRDDRYIRIEGKVVFQVYKPVDVPDIEVFVSVFQDLAREHGLGEIYFIGANCTDAQAKRLTCLNGFTSNEHAALRSNTESRFIDNRKSLLGRVESKIRKLFGGRSFYDLKKPVIIDYGKAIQHLLHPIARDYDYFYTVVPDWDNCARAGNKALILRDSTPELWERHLREAVGYASKTIEFEKRIIFVKSWNEWAEGNYLEPDRKWGHRYLEAVRKVLTEDVVS